MLSLFLLPEQIDTDYLPVLLLLSRFSRVRLCATPQTAAHQAPPSLGFSRQEHWSGLPFPSPMRESEVAQSYRLLTTPWTAAYQAPPSMGFSRQEYCSGVPLPSPTYLREILSLTKPKLTHDITGESNSQLSSHSSEQKCQVPKDKICRRRGQVKRNTDAQVHIIDLSCLLGPCCLKCDLKTVSLRCPQGASQKCKSCTRTAGSQAPGWFPAMGE